MSTSIDDESVFIGEREPWPLLPPFPPIPTDLPRTEYNKLLIQCQKEYIKFIGVHADQIKKMYTALEHNFQARDDKMMLLVQIESTKAKYLPTDIDEEKWKEMKRQWCKRRLKLKLKYFFQHDVMKWVVVAERVAAVVILLSGWGMLGSLISVGKWPVSAMPPIGDTGQTGQAVP